MDATLWTIIGLVMSLGGVLLLFFFGMPYPAERKRSAWSGQGPAFQDC